MNRPAIYRARFGPGRLSAERENSSEPWWLKSCPIWPVYSLPPLLWKANQSDDDSLKGVQHLSPNRLPRWLCCYSQPSFLLFLINLMTLAKGVIPADSQTSLQFGFQCLMPMAYRNLYSSGVTLLCCYSNNIEKCYLPVHLTQALSMFDTPMLYKSKMVWNEKSSRFVKLTLR